MATYLGRTVAINVDVNGVGGAGADWRKIAEQRGASLQRGTDTADTTSKDTGGWAQAIPSGINWSISADGALDPADPAWTYLLQQWAAMAKIYVQFDASAIGGEKKEGQAIITNLTNDAPNADAVTYTVELKGDQELTDSP